MTTRSRAAIAVLFVCLAAGLLPAQTRTFPVDDLRPGMVGTGRTVFEGDRLDEFKAHILGVLRNTIGPRRNLILARLEGGPLANTGVIAGMSGSPVYIDGRLVGAVSYSLGQFSKEPIAGITPFDEMVEAATLPSPRRQAARVELTTPITQEGLRAALSQAFAWTKPFADSPNDVQLFGQAGVNAGIGTLLRPIATPITLGGFDPSVIDPVASAFRDRGFLPVMAGGSMRMAAAQQGASASASTNPDRPLRPGDPIGVALMSGDLELGATGTVTEVAGDRVYAFGHPFYGLGPTSFPLTRAHVHVVLPSLTSSMKIASTGEVIGTVLQDRATTIAGTLGPGPSMIPITLNLNAERGTRKTFKMAMVRDQLFTPLLAYLSVLNTLTSYERENGIASYAVHGSAQIKNHAPLAFEDLFSGDQPSVGAAASVVTPINVLLRNSFEDVEIDALTLDIQASEQARSATLERVWLDGTRVKPGSTVNIKVLLRSYRGEEIMKSLPLQVPANARGSLSVMVSDGVRLSQWESRELQVQPLQTRGVPQLLKVLNSARRNNRLYVRLITRDGGAIVKGESLAALPPSVLAVMESDRSGGSFRPLQSAVLGEWEIPTDLAVTGSRTLTLPLED
ncbi:MAG TPA: SpoIVB peptidase S55 domain-containing protein [Vicinamibacterales bacterium]|nr:SpoIVB peptidase S55 domain-containing protein [Vicinamibacterales bacterium]